MELIDRQALLDAMTDYWNGMAEYHTHLDGETAVYVDNKCLVKRMPAIEAEPVIHCKDCRWWDKSEGSTLGYCHAAKHGYYSSNWEISIYRTHKENFYCGDAERREVRDDN